MTNERIVRVYEYSLKGYIEAFVNSPIVGPLPRVARLTGDGVTVSYREKDWELTAKVDCIDESRKSGQRVIISVL